MLRCRVPIAPAGLYEAFGNYTKYGKWRKNFGKLTNGEYHKNIYAIIYIIIGKFRYCQFYQKIANCKSLLLSNILSYTELEIV